MTMYVYLLCVLPVRLHVLSGLGCIGHVQLSVAQILSGVCYVCVHYVHILLRVLHVIMMWEKLKNEW